MGFAVRAPISLPSGAEQWALAGALTPTTFVPTTLMTVNTSAISRFVIT